jgi:hypothetical protein
MFVALGSGDDRSRANICVLAAVAVDANLAGRCADLSHGRGIRRSRVSAVFASSIAVTCALRWLGAIASSAVRRPSTSRAGREVRRQLDGARHGVELEVDHDRVDTRDSRLLAPVGAERDEEPTAYPQYGGPEVPPQPAVVGLPDRRSRSLGNAVDKLRSDGRALGTLCR